MRDELPDDAGEAIDESGRAIGRAAGAALPDSALAAVRALLGGRN
jgi:hypothetical protein